MSCTTYKTNATHQCLVCLGCLMYDDVDGWDHLVSDLPPKGHRIVSYKIERFGEPPIVTLIRETNRLLERLDQRLEGMSPGSIVHIDKEKE